MELDSDDEVLRVLADGDNMDYSKWPELLDRIITRLENIVYEFPPPPVPRQLPILLSSQPIPSSPPLPASLHPLPAAEASSQDSKASTEAPNKENAPPESISSKSSLPPHIQSLFDSIITTLKTLFTEYPPHTIQRFSELILNPRQHYKSLYSYLHAVDRVVHVTSGANVFPLPPAVPDPSAASVLSNGLGTTDPASISWGNPTSTAQATLGSDESLGGALLTPILWLNKSANNHVGDLEGEVRTESTETIEGPNGPGGVETVTVSVNGISSTTAATIDNGNASLRAEGGVTQGELLRQEQKAGVVPAAQLSGHGRGDCDGMGEDDEVPHARGPEEIGMQDMGPQASGTAMERGSGSAKNIQAIDVVAAVGRTSDESTEEEEEEEGEENVKEEAGTPKREAEEDIGPEEKRIKEDQEERKSPDVDMVDVDGKTEEEKKVGEDDENIGPDAVDSSTV
ncbi:hypothetical protein BP5796_03345 [Coleophoma crateriformis]|uniref:Uncharacterized protein n=1 Tax=Coleophoma crateriformis TaxID=565419 RepID=A0A3D8SN97_9HELO|nr:hypothetical protein BP5796_03345 [Coleophoma crateriformis]